MSLSAFQSLCVQEKYWWVYLNSKQISYAEQSENFATDVAAAFSHWVIDHLVDLHHRCNDCFNDICNEEFKIPNSTRAGDLQREIQEQM